MIDKSEEARLRFCVELGRLDLVTDSLALVRAFHRAVRRCPVLLEVADFGPVTRALERTARTLEREHGATRALCSALGVPFLRGELVDGAGRRDVDRRAHGDVDAAGRAGLAGIPAVRDHALRQPEAGGPEAREVVPPDAVGLDARDRAEAGLHLAADRAPEEHVTPRVLHGGAVGAGGADLEPRVAAGEEHGQGEGEQGRATTVHGNLQGEV